MQANSDIANNPRWLWESIALYLAQDSRKKPTDIDCMTSRNFPTIEQLNVPVSSPLRNPDCNIYTVGYFLIEYIEELWGIDAVNSLILSNGDIVNTLNMSVNDFEFGWHEFVQERYLD